jgi:hypothetical protein
VQATRASARDRKNAIIEEVKEEARKLRTADGEGGGPEVLDRDVAARQACGRSLHVCSLCCVYSTSASIGTWSES